MNISGLFALSTSALRAYMVKQAVTAHNVANVNTDSFQPSEAIMREGTNGGVTVTTRKSDEVGTDLVKEMTEMITTSVGIEMNLKTVQTANELTRTIIDLKA